MDSIVSSGALPLALGLMATPLIFLSIAKLLLIVMFCSCLIVLLILILHHDRRGVKIIGTITILPIVLYVLVTILLLINEQPISWP